MLTGPPPKFHETWDILQVETKGFGQPNSNLELAMDVHCDTGEGEIPG
jgi:hypothetical protein